MKFRILFVCLWSTISIMGYLNPDIAMLESRIIFLETAIQKAFCFSENCKEKDFFLKPPMVSRSGWASRYIAYDLGIKSNDVNYSSRIYVDNDGVIRSFSIPLMKKKNTSFDVDNSLGIVWYEIIKNINYLWHESEMKQKFKVELDNMIFEVTHQPSFSRFVCNRIG